MANYNLGVITTYPGLNDVDVSRDSLVKIQFNRDLSESSIEGNFYVEKKVSEGSYLKINGVTSYDERVLTFDPSGSLDASTVYRITVVGDSPNLDETVDGIKDIFGNAMLGSFVYIFTTTNTSPLSIPVITKPTNDVIFNQIPILSWNTVAGATEYEVQLSASGDFIADLWSANTTEVSVVPNTVLVDGVYYCRVRYKTATETSLWSDVVRFHYEEAFIPASYHEDIFDIVNTSPLNGSANNNITSISVVFNSEVNQATINNNTVSLVRFPGTYLNITCVVSGSTVTITPQDGLESNCEYQLVIDSTVAGTNAIQLGFDCVVNFSTQFTPLYADYQDVYYDLYPLTENLPQQVIYRAIREASSYAKELRSYIETNNSSLTATDWEDMANIPFYIKQFVRYQAGYTLFMQTYQERYGAMGKLKQLGDFILQDTGNITNDVNNIISDLKKRIKPWQDQIMNLGMSRGYAMPQSATRGESSYAYPSFMTRNETEE